MAIPPPLPQQPEKVNPTVPQDDARSKPAVPLLGWIAIGLAGAGLIAALVWWLLTGPMAGKQEPYSDGSNEPVLRQEVTAPEPQASDEVPLVRVTPHSMHGWGTNGNMPFSLDISVDSEGKVSGTYWNILYCLKFSVNGTENPGNEDLDLELVSGSVTTPLHLDNSGNGNYTGTWGSKQNAVNIHLKPGLMPSASVEGMTIYTGRITGNGMDREFNITQDDAHNAFWYWYDYEGFANRLKLKWGSEEFSLYTKDGKRVATFDFEGVNENGQENGTLTDACGQSFKVVLSDYLGGE